MATRIVYSKELKEKILKEINEGKDIKDISERYEVPVVVIEDWKRKNELDTYLNVSIFNTEVIHNSKWNYAKEKYHLAIGWIKTKLLLSSLLAGMLFVAAISFSFNGDAEFSPSFDTNADLSPKIDSLIIQGTKIVNSLNRQNEITLSISNTVTNIHEIQKPPKTIRIYKKRYPVQKTGCCCMCTRCSNDNKCKKDTIK